MSCIKLRSGDIALLERLSFLPREIGDLPVDTVARLTALGLVRKVLGCCEITRQGQLILRRQYFLKTSRRKVVRVTHSNPLFLSDERFSSFTGRSRLRDHLNMRRALDNRVRRAVRLPRWLVRLASETAGRFRAVDEPLPGPGVLARPKLKHEPH